MKPRWALAQPNTAVIHGYEREVIRREMDGSSSLIAQSCAIGMVSWAPIETNEHKAQLAFPKRSSHAMGVKDAQGMFDKRCSNQ